MTSRARDTPENPGPPASAQGCQVFPMTRDRCFLCPDVTHQGAHAFPQVTPLAPRVTAASRVETQHWDQRLAAHNVELPSLLSSSSADQLGGEGLCSGPHDTSDDPAA